jgi:hypothetical protein
MVTDLTIRNRWDMLKDESSGINPSIRGAVFRDDFRVRFRPANGAGVSCEDEECFWGRTLFHKIATATARLIVTSGNAHEHRISIIHCRDHYPAINSINKRLSLAYP